MVTVRCRIAAVGTGGYGHIAGIGRALAAVQYLGAVDFLEVALVNAGFDSFDIKDDRPVLLVGRHLGQGDALFTVVTGRDRIQALVVRIAVVQVAVHHDLPGDFHLVTVYGGKDCVILLRLIENRAVIGNGHPVLTVGKDIAGARVFLRSQAVDVGGVGDFDNLVTFHDVDANTGDPGIGLVVNP